MWKGRNFLSPTCLPLALVSKSPLSLLGRNDLKRGEFYFIWRGNCRKEVQEPLLYGTRLRDPSPKEGAEKETLTLSEGLGAYSLKEGSPELLFCNNLSI